MHTAKHRPLWLIMVAVSAPMFMASLDNLVVTNALPVIEQELGASIEELSWVINAYTLSFASLILMSSALADRFGRRNVFMAGLAIFVAASAWCGMSDTATELIMARAVQGIGGAALLPLSLTLLSTSVSEEMRPAAIGIWGGVSGLGVALGPLVGGAVVEGVNWEAIFWINVPLGLMCLPLIWYALPESYGRRQPLDLCGLLCAVLGIFSLTYGIVRGNDAGWGSSEILGTVVGGLILLGIFVWWESRTVASLLPLRLFCNRSFTGANLVGLIFSFGIFGSVFILTQFLQIVLGASPLTAGFMTMPWTCAPLVVAPLTGFITPRIGIRPVILAGLVLMAVALFWFAANIDPEIEYRSMVPAMLAAGVGMGLIFAPIATATLANVVAEDQATASGANSTAREIGVALGIAVLTAVFTGAGGQLNPFEFSDAAAPALYVGAGALCIAVPLALIVPRKSGVNS